MKKICVITGTRAEYSLLRNLIKKIEKDKQLELRLVVTGMHLCPEFGLTYKEVEEDEIKIDEKVEIMLSSDTSVGMTKSTGLAMLAFAEYFQRKTPDILIVLGDRFEIFACATAAAMAHIPIAHIAGGDTTEGAIDEFFRHSITKMSYLHFTNAQIYKKRVEQLGEDPSRVFCVGSLGIENIMQMKLLTKEELQVSIEFELDREYALVTFHPTTMEDNEGEKQIQQLLEAIDEYPDMKFIFTKANADASGRRINVIIEEYVSTRENCRIFTSLGGLRYLSAMKYAKMVIGNSSSGIYETPTFKIPTVNIGDRQKGRLQANSIINCEPKKETIYEAIRKAREKNCKQTINPYQGANPSSDILYIIKDFLVNQKINLKKKFYDQFI